MNPGARAVALFREHFGMDPAASASAPGRVNLIGEHIDYHGGHVLPVATAERTAVAVGPGRGRLRAVSEHGPEVELPWPNAAGRSWTDYVSGVAHFLAHRLPVLEDGIAIAVCSDLPVGAGLSSSGALEVAAAAAFAAWARIELSERELVDAAFRAESEYVGMPCGMMDQLAAVYARPHAALLIDCRTNIMTTVPVGVDLCLVVSGQSRELRDSAYGERRREGVDILARLRPQLPNLVALVDVPPAALPGLARSLPEPLGRRLRHVVNENQRTILAARALESGDHAAFGMLVNASHDSLRDLYECSTDRLDAIVAAARGVPRALGARLTGAGWGGSVLVVAEPGAGGAVAAHLRGDETLALPSVRVVSPGDGVASALTLGAAGL
jgi:galactokinase